MFDSICFALIQFQGSMLYFIQELEVLCLATLLTQTLNKQCTQSTSLDSQRF